MSGEVPDQGNIIPSTSYELMHRAVRSELMAATLRKISAVRLWDKVEGGVGDRSCQLKDGFIRARGLLQALGGGAYWEVANALDELADSDLRSHKESWMWGTTNQLLRLIILSRVPVNDPRCSLNPQAVQAEKDALRRELRISEEGQEGEFPGVTYWMLADAIIQGNVRMGNPAQRDPHGVLEAS